MRKMGNVCIPRVTVYESRITDQSMQAQEICRVNVIVEGQVQGVGFRAFVRNRASQLGLTGWVRNMPDGRVESQAQGTRPALDTFIQSLWQGPVLSSVTNVEISWVEAHGEDSAFQIVL